MPPPKQIERVFNDLRAHFGDVRPNTEFAILQSLRQHYAEHHVTCASRTDCDLLGFAAAGHAETNPSLIFEAFDLTRCYSKPLYRVDRGKLINNVRFAQHDYGWRGMDYLLFEVNCVGSDGQMKELLYILTPRKYGGVAGGLSSSCDALMMAAGAWTAELHNEVWLYDNSTWTKDYTLWENVQASSWDELILEPEAKADLFQDVHEFFNHGNHYFELSVPWKRGIVLHGIPGNGKTLAVKALIKSLYGREDQIPTLYVKTLKGPEGSKESTAKVFRHARSMSPCMLVFADLDYFTSDDDDTVRHFLDELDAPESNDGILVMGISKSLDHLSPAITKRPRRFNRKYHFNLPGEVDRERYCDFWRQKVAGRGMIEFPQSLCSILAKLTEGFSFAYLKEAFVAALQVAARGFKGDDDSEDAEDSSGEGGNNFPADGRKKLIMPEIQVPAALEDNLLLIFFSLQAASLIKEMNTLELRNWISSSPTIATDRGGRLRPNFRSTSSVPLRHAQELAELSE